MILDRLKLRRPGRHIGVCRHGTYKHTTTTFIILLEIAEHEREA